MSEFHENFVVLFFRSIKLFFRALSKHYKDHFLAKFLCRSQKFEKKAKNCVFKHFLNNFDKKSFFFGALSPLKLVCISSEGAFRKFFKSFSQNGCLEIVQKGTLWVCRGSNHRYWFRLLPRHKKRRIQEIFNPVVTDGRLEHL